MSREKMKTAYGAGDVRRARELALALAEEEGAAGKEARALLEATEVDKRALLIGGAALALGLFYLFAFVLLR